MRFTQLLSVASLPLAALAAPRGQLPFSVQEPERFETLTHSELSHTVRVRTPIGLCDTDVHQKSGYLDTPENRHFFFWFFESRNDPVNDPVVLWLNGGPGCSSFTGLLQELGPCRIQKKGELPAYNPFSWTSNASVFFLDQPIGVGFSYGEKDDKGVWSTPAAAKDVHAFLQIFFRAFPNYGRKGGFHIAGESYCGRYIPLFASHIVSQNALVDAGESSFDKIPLKSVMVGNGFTNPLIQYPAYYPTVCTNQTGYGPFIGADECENMQKTLPRCEALVQRCFDEPTNSVVCLAANTYCEKTQTEPYYKTGRNPYDMLKFGDYEEERQIAYFLNREDVRHQLGVDHEAHGGVKKFIGCSDTVGYRFSATGDQSKPSFPNVTHIIENGVDALFYSGDRDFICNWWGNNHWLSALEWSGKDKFNAQPLRPWYASESAESQAGLFRQSGRLAFATVASAGHFVPYDRPIESLEMANAWLHDRTLPQYKQK